MRTTSSTYLKAIFEGCIEHGTPEEAIIGCIEGGRNGLENPSRRYPARVVAEVLNMAAAATNNAAMGVHVGITIRPETFLDIGYALPFCQNLTEVIATNETYQALTQQNGMTRLSMRGGSSWLEWQPLYKDIEFYRYFVEMVFAGYASIGRWLLWGKDNPVISMHFRHSRPENIEVHKTVFVDNLIFDAKTDAVEFMGHTVEVPMPNRNPDMLGFLKKRLDVQLAQLDMPVDIVTETLRCIQSGLAEGRPAIGSIATILGMGERTLRRHLSAQGESFRTVLERARKDSCEVYLREKKYGQAEIAHMLGFNDQSAYSRAFRGWFGMTPREYQTQLLT